MKTIAIVEWLVGFRGISKLIAAADLGIPNYGITQRYAITYADGEVVDEARVMKAVQAIMDGLDRENSEFIISCPKVISITQVQA